MCVNGGMYEGCRVCIDELEKKVKIDTNLCH
uniref:Uncharacterized protein n=1 Tax=Anguilla anguilla TaxID=7936 RepID=A0A0E9QRN2_ANGAN